ncbi:MaoC family dehydratase N-terminal domain-containing protein [Marinobacter sp. NFXS11]|uniref:FAS1-like dehydratase domain-containing protein n=1 Tax=Marinobacter sp. NFXS11 TaxID=2818432 RepID=UPI0032E016F3
MSNDSSNGDFQDWIGREEAGSAKISPATVEAMAATTDLDSYPAEGQPLPPGWQWLFFNPKVRRSLLGVDGHPAKGGFLPPVPLPRRMWAGSRIRYLEDLPVGSNATRKSRILSVKAKSGRQGSLCFVTVEHTISAEDRVRIVEEQDIVYREPTPPQPGTAPEPAVHEATPQWTETVTPDTTLLFRYSALTFNGHRIHYDLPYACEEEGYKNLVVHGPLTATLLQQFAVKHGGDRRLKEFSFRGVAPLFVDAAFTLEGREKDETSLEIWARGPEGQLAMSAMAVFG